MKKIKLLTSTALVGMTAGAVLPMVTSCGESTYANIKFKLDDGIAASAPKFTIGDKVVIDYKIIDEDVFVSEKTITVLFDGWKVKSSNKTWGFNLDKRTITIYNAPTTDITVKIKTGNKKESSSETFNLTIVAGDYYIITPDNEKIYDGKTFTDQVNGSSINDIFLNYSISHNEPSLWRWTGWKISGTGQAIDPSTPLSENTSIEPSFEYIDEPEPGEEFSVQFQSYDSDYSFALGQISIDNETYTTGSLTTTIDSEHLNITLGEFEDSVYKKSYTGCQYAGICDISGNLYTAEDKAKPLSYYSSGTIYFRFEPDADHPLVWSNPYDLGYFWWTPATPEEAETYQVPYVEAGQTIVFVIDPRDFSDETKQFAGSPRLAVDSGEDLITNKIASCQVITYLETQPIINAECLKNDASDQNYTTVRFYDENGDEYTWAAFCQLGVLGIQIEVASGFIPGKRISLLVHNDAE